MSIKDIFNASKIKNENEELKRQISELSTPEYRELESIRKKIEDLNQDKTQIENTIVSLNEQVNKLEKDIDYRKEKIVELDEEELMQSFGLYKPTYDFATSELYKDELDSVRKKQKELIKNGTAATGSMNWTVNNSLSQGKKMVRDMQKLLLRAFNAECDETISKAKYNNMAQCEKRIKSSEEAISKLGKLMSVTITQRYYNLKISELHLAHEYQLKKQEEKEEQRRIREEIREQAKLEKEIQEARSKIEKEQKHYTNALKKIVDQLNSNNLDEETRAELEKKKIENEEILNDLEVSLKDVDYRAANQKAGYVYIISNIGSFGENVYKIGMTRRLDPQERVDELGDASVPFSFDVHAMIFSDNAPALETALHNAFEDKKVNMINGRKEFFNVTLDEIEKVVKENYDKTVDFVRIAPAEQFRESLRMK